MDHEDKEKLARALELSEENNRILRKMLRAMRWARIARIIYWVVLIGASIGVFYYFQPLFDQILGIFRGFTDTIDDVNSLLSQ